jgi:hypothetical protein
VTSFAQPDAPVPIAAVYDPGGPTVTVTFSCPLISRSLDATNWFVRVGNVRYGAIGASSAGDHVTLVVIADGANVGADVVSFTPPPFDVVSAVGGVQAAAFADFPLITV